MRQRQRRRLGWWSALIASVLTAGFIVVVCGFNCFMPSGPNPFLAYFIILLTVLAALAHDRLSRAWLPRPDEPA